MDKWGKMGNFANKAIVAFLAGTVLLFVCPHHAFGQLTTWRTVNADDVFAIVDVSDGAPTDLEPTSGSSAKVVNNDSLAFRAAGHTLTITDDGKANTVSGGVTILGSITVLPSGGGGTLIFDLQNSSTQLKVGSIGADDRRVSTVRVRRSGSSLEVGNVFAGTLTIDKDQKLTASTIDAVTLTNDGTLETTDAIDVGTLTNNGKLTTESGTVGILGGNGDIESADNLMINNTASGGFSGNIIADDLTVRQGLFGGNIETIGNFTANLTGNLIITGELKVGVNATFSGNGRADLGIVDITGDTTIGNGGTGTTTVAVDGAGMIDAGATLGQVTVSSNGILEVYGDTTKTDAIGEWIGGDLRAFRNMALFTDWGIDNGTGEIKSFGMRDQACMSDGYLAAFTMHHRYTAWNMVRDRLISGNGSHGRGYRGQASACLFCEQPSLCDCTAKSAWLNATGRYNTYRSSFNDQNWKTSTGGGQVGFDLFKASRFQSGLLFGYEDSKSRNEGDRLKANDFYFGLYGAYLFRNGVDARIVFAQGWQNYDLNRTGNGDVLYTSSFKGGTSEANFEFGRRVAWGGWSLRPVLAVDVYNNNLKAAQETGNGGEGVIYGKTSLTQLFIRTGTDLRHRTKDYTFNSGIYYAHDVNKAELATRVTSVNDAEIHAPLVGTKLGHSLLMFNLGVEGEISANFLLFFGYQGEYAIDSANGAFHSIGFVGFIGKW